MRAMKSFGKICVMAVLGLSLAAAVSGCGRKGPLEPPAFVETN